MGADGNVRPAAAENVIPYRGRLGDVEVDVPAAKRRRGVPTLSGQVGAGLVDGVCPPTPRGGSEWDSSSITDSSDDD